MRYYVSGYTSVGQPVFYCGSDEEGVPVISTNADKSFYFVSHLEASLRAEWLNESFFCHWSVKECKLH